MSKFSNQEERLMQIIHAPYISEKATLVGEQNKQTVFRVAQDATKKEIKAAVELIWKDQKIEVEKVQSLNVKGKQKRFGRYMGKRSNWKKAIVSIKDGKDINFAEFSKAEAK